MYIGDRLFNLADLLSTNLFNLGSQLQLTHSAYELMVEKIDSSREKIWNLTYPIGVNTQGEVMHGNRKYKKQQIISEYNSLANYYLPLNTVYHLVTYCEAFICGSIRLILLQFPKKIGQNKKVKISNIFDCTSLDSIRFTIIDEYINELTYMSPKDLACALENIYGFNLNELPSYQRYREIKATRDIYIHNQGIANQAYLTKAGSHGRVKDGKTLPMNIGYFLNSYETCLQLSENLKDEFNRIWPSDLYLQYKKELAYSKVELGQLPPPSIHE